MSGPQITVGLPVFNGADLVGESLDALLAQTYRDFRVLVFDNASTDATPEIIAGYAARDSRVTLHRQPENVGALRNFVDVLAAAETPYFLWRADDDLCSPDYLERLATALGRVPEAALAAPTVETRKPHKRPRLTAYAARRAGPRIWTILHRMFRCRPAWIYGLWRTERLRAYNTAAWEAFPYARANDHLVILQAILDDAITGDAEARFIQRVGMRPGPPRPGPDPAADRAEARHRLALFRAACRAQVDRRDWTRSERWLLGLVLEAYVRKRV